MLPKMPLKKTSIVVLLRLYIDAAHASRSVCLQDVQRANTGMSGQHRVERVQQKVVCSAFKKHLYLIKDMEGVFAGVKAANTHI
jgi:hypothetical protein